MGVEVKSGPVRVAQVGIGYWGPNLLRNLVASPSFDVRCVADASEERRGYVQGLYPNVDTLCDASEIWERDDVEAVVIATPASTHFEFVSRALASGRHVLVEKPMAMTIEEVDRIRILSEEHGRVAMVGDTFLYNPAVAYMKKSIESGEIGDVRYIYSQRVNLGRIRQDVDALWNLAPHDVSIIQYLLGYPEPLAVNRSGMDFLQAGIEDVVFLNMTYPGKVMAQVHVSWLDPCKLRIMTVVGSRKMIVYDDIADNKISVYDKGIDPHAVLGENMNFDRPAFTRFDYRSGDVLLPRIDGVEPLRAEIEHYADCIRNGTPCRTGPEHARSVIRILSAQAGGSDVRG